MIGVGPFSIQTLMVAGALVLAWLAARHSARRQPGGPYKAAGALLVDVSFWGFIIARLVYIGLWWNEYARAPKSMIAISDGGFAWRVGVPAALVLIWWKTRANIALRRPVVVGVITGVALWVVANGALSLVLRTTTPLPDLALSTLDGQPTTLDAYAGRPVVLNLWASWCPPCRREMPVFERAQAAFPDVSFVMINQGESAQQARNFLRSEGLELDNVLLDPDSSALHAMRSRGLPTTLFFDAQGRMVSTHLGEITMPALKDTVSSRLDSSAAPTK